MGRINTNDVRPQQSDELTLSEIRDDHDSLAIDVISPQSQAEFRRWIEEENLAEEVVEILIAKAPDKNALQVITPNVNGTNQPIVRGYPTRVKLKYVLALSHSKQTDFETVQKDPFDKASISYAPNTYQSYPFEVRRCSDKARALIENAVASPL